MACRRPLCRSAIRRRHAGATVLAPAPGAGGGANGVGSAARHPRQRLPHGVHRSRAVLRVDHRAGIEPHATAGEHVARALFSDKMPDDAIRRYMQRFQGELLLVTLDLLALELPPSLPTLDVPVLVLGAENDRFVFPGALQATAYTYRTKAEIFSGMAHAMMLDHGWERVATRIAEWLEATLSECEPAARGIA